MRTQRQFYSFLWQACSEFSFRGISKQVHAQVMTRMVRVPSETFSMELLRAISVTRSELILLARIWSWHGSRYLDSLCD